MTRVDGLVRAATSDGPRHYHDGERFSVEV